LVGLTASHDLMDRVEAMKSRDSRSESLIFRADVIRERWRNGHPSAKSGRETGGKVKLPTNTGTVVEEGGTPREGKEEGIPRAHAETGFHLRRPHSGPPLALQEHLMKEATKDSE